VAIFDLGQAEFYLGYAYYSQGRLKEAGLAFSVYHDASEKLIQIDPGNADWVMEMAYAFSNLGNIEKRRDQADPQNTLGLFKSALQNAELAARLDTGWATQLAGFNADVADAWLGICNLKEALKARLNNVQYAERYYELDPGNNIYKKTYAFSLAGLAGVQRQAGFVEIALANLQRSNEVLNELHQGDRTRLQYRWNLFEKSGRAAYLMTLAGKTDEAQVWYQQIENMAMALIRDDRNISLGHSIDYPDFLVHYADAAFRWGESEKALRLLGEGTKRIEDILQEYPREKDALEVLARAEFYRWAHDGKGASGTGPDPLPAEESHGRQGCKDLDFSARRAVMTGDLERAREYSAVLHQKSYREPEFMRICAQHNFCAE
jgi:tetratricopeptide (TPR) repeat protein